MLCIKQYSSEQCDPHSPKPFLEQKSSVTSGPNCTPHPRLLGARPFYTVSSCYVLTTYIHMNACTYIQANCTYIQANCTYIQANCTYIQANCTYIQANCTYIQANCMHRCSMSVVMPSISRSTVDYNNTML